VASPLLTPQLGTALGVGDKGDNRTSPFFLAANASQALALATCLQTRACQLASWLPQTLALLIQFRCRALGTLQYSLLNRLCLIHRVGTWSCFPCWN